MCLPCLSPYFHSESRSHAGAGSCSACQRSAFGYRTGRDGTGSRFVKRLGRLSGDPAPPGASGVADLYCPRAFSFAITS